MEYTIEDRFILSSRNNLKVAISIYKPDGLQHPSPTIVMGHGIGAIKAAGLSPFAGIFASEGYVAVTFDYINFGESEGTPRNVLHVREQLQDFRDVLASFGGMHVTSLVSRARELAAGIAQCPLVDGLAGCLQMPLARSLKLTAAAVVDIVG
ncbi:Uncharacterized protein C8034_v003652 [Colletotrichum sidae]|uniref:Dienelactone hydrolase domain-containing protein n=1 Tax=Colletotrichum sidae TaxID=1347389 RepID=A0A4R8T9I4_9PEZI|nr:Uncharacterized protein C8034_v003652 [Colletotrichum sidae]